MVVLIRDVGVDIDMPMIGLTAVLLVLVHLAMMSNTRVDNLAIMHPQMDRGDTVQVSLVPYNRARRNGVGTPTYVSSPIPKRRVVAVRCGVTPWMELVIRKAEMHWISVPGNENYSHASS